MKNLSDDEINFFDRDNIRCTPEEGRKMVAKSGMLLVLGWDLEKIFLLDQIMRREDPMFAKEFGEHGSEVHLSLKAFAIWAKAPNTERPIVLQGIQQRLGEVVIRMLEDTNALKFATITTHATHFAKLAT